MKILFVIALIIFLGSIPFYNKWSYKEWYKRCENEDTGYGWFGKYHDHRKDG